MSGSLKIYRFEEKRIWEKKEKKKEWRMGKRQAIKTGKKARRESKKERYQCNMLIDWLISNHSIYVVQICSLIYLEGIDEK